MFLCLSVVTWKSVILDRATFMIIIMKAIGKIEVIVRIVTDLPTKGGDRRYLTPLTKSFQSNLLTRMNKKCLLEYMNAIVILFLELHYGSFATKSINSIF